MGVKIDTYLRKMTVVNSGRTNKGGQLAMQTNTGAQVYRCTVHRCMPASVRPTFCPGKMTGKHRTNLAIYKGDTNFARRQLDEKGGGKKLWGAASPGSMRGGIALHNVVLECIETGSGHGIGGEGFSLFQLNLDCKSNCIGLKIPLYCTVLKTGADNGIGGEGFAQGPGGCGG